MNGNFFLQLINDNAAQVVFAMALCVILGLMWLSHFIGKWKERGGLFEDWRRRIPKIEVLIEEVNKKLDNIGQDVRELQKETASPIMTRKSPISLNEKGEEISKTIDAKNIVASVFEQFFVSLSKDILKSPYDIQEMAFEYMNDVELNQTIVDTLKKTAYAEGISMFDMKRILGILLRNMALEKCDFAPEDVDKHTPLD